MMKKFKLLYFIMTFVFTIYMCQVTNSEIIQKKNVTLSNTYNIKIVTKLSLIKTIKLLNILNDIILKENYNLQSKEIIISKNDQDNSLSIPQKIKEFISKEKISSYWIIYIHPNFKLHNVVLGADLFLVVNCDNFCMTCYSIGE